MFYETAQTVGPGWTNRSYKPSHYEDMSWSPPRQFHSPGSSPETYRRIIHTEDEEDFPRRAADRRDDDFFRRSSPTFPRRIFKEVWGDDANHRFGERPKMFKKVFRPNHNWDEDFDRDLERVRRLDKEFDDDIRHKDFRARDLKKDIEEEFEKAAGRVHHIPIMVERKIEEMKSRFGRNSSPPPSPSHSEEPEPLRGVNRIRKNFEQEKEKPRWDTVHTLPTRKHAQPSNKSVFRSYSETHEDVPKQQHSSAFRSHSDGHCPKKTYVTKIEVKLPPEPSCSKEEEPPPKEEDQKDPSLQQIAAVLQNVEDLVVRVDAYSGTGRDKQYRFLDEMLTRCMLRLDDVNTEGREDVRNARRAAVREVQSCIDKLEAKADESERAQQAKNNDTNVEEPNEDHDSSEPPKQEQEQKSEASTTSDEEHTKL